MWIRNNFYYFMYVKFLNIILFKIIRVKDLLIYKNIFSLINDF
jgi:hypothetical protein